VLILSKMHKHESDAAKELEAILKNPKYESFVKQLGEAITDPKVVSVLNKGLRDGQKWDDIVRTKTIVKEAHELRPIQKEIDLTKSLGYIGKHPKIVPLILRGGPLKAKHFGGSPIVTAKGKYIVDGHHKWSEVYMINPNANIETVSLNIDHPEEALRVSQVGIAAKAGKLNIQKVTKGKNIYKMSTEAIQKDMVTYLSPEFYDAFYKSDSKRFKTKADVHDHVLSNILKMRVESKSATKISRSHMPQYDDAGATVVAEALHKGKINIKKPFLGKKELEKGNVKGVEYV